MALFQVNVDSPLLDKAYHLSVEARDESDALTEASKIALAQAKTAMVDCDETLEGVRRYATLEGLGLETRIVLEGDLDMVPIGRVIVDVPEHMLNAFDVVLAPAVTLRIGDPDSKPKISHWQLMRRTKVDTRPRDPNPPHRHIGPGADT